MIPLKDENPTRTTPYVVYAIIVLNFIVFLYNGTLRPNGDNPLAGFELVPRALTMGAESGISTPIPAWMTIFTAMFMHANWLHIVGNMLYLWIFGNNIEDVLGHFRFLAFYLVAGVVATMAQVLTDPASTISMVGASGAIAGVLGAYLVLFPKARVLTLIFVVFFIQVVALPAYVVLGVWILLDLLNSLQAAGAAQGSVGGVAYLAHVGGFAAGIVMILLCGGRRLLRRNWYTHSEYW